MSAIFKTYNHWKRALKMIFKESGCFQFPEVVVTSTAIESLRCTCNVHVKRCIYRMGITSTSSCFIGAEQPCTVVTNFGSEGKPML